MAEAKKNTPAKATEQPTVTPPDLDAVQSAASPLDSSTPAIEDETAVTMADVAALNGIGLAPDESDVRLADEHAKPFISAGMQSDLEAQGWCIDPATGKKIVRDKD